MVSRHAHTHTNSWNVYELKHHPENDNHSKTNIVINKVDVQQQDDDWRKLKTNVYIHVQVFPGHDM